MILRRVAPDTFFSGNAPAGRAARAAKFSEIPRRNRPAVIIKICARVTASGILNLIIMLNYEMNKHSDTNENAGRGCVGGFPRLFAVRAARPAGFFTDKFFTFFRFD